nr:hypothetical protein [Pseudomonadota bacterium]
KLDYVEDLQEKVPSRVGITERIIYIRNTRLIPIRELQHNLAYSIYNNVRFLEFGLLMYNNVEKFTSVDFINNSLKRFNNDLAFVFKNIPLIIIIRLPRVVANMTAVIENFDKIIEAMSLRSVIFCITPDEIDLPKNEKLVIVNIKPTLASIVKHKKLSLLEQYYISIAISKKLIIPELEFTIESYLCLSNIVIRGIIDENVEIDFVNTIVLDTHLKHSYRQQFSDLIYSLLFFSADNKSYFTFGYCCLLGLPYFKPKNEVQPFLNLMSSHKYMGEKIDILKLFFGEKLYQHGDCDLAYKIFNEIINSPVGNCSAEARRYLARMCNKGPNCEPNHAESSQHLQKLEAQSDSSWSPLFWCTNIVIASLYIGSEIIATSLRSNK